MPNFLSDEKNRLEPYVSNTEGDTFCVRNLNGIVGAVYARYSRAETGFRETLLREFVEADMIDHAHAADLIERVLIAYGDDSVGELEGTHVSFENISIMATKEIEDRRIGGSPIEKSTRYVFYDRPDEDGRFRYYRDPDIMASRHGDLYVETMDFIFKTYADLVAPMQEYYSGLKSIDAAEYDINGDGVKEKFADLTSDADRKSFKRTYQNDIRTKSCDTLRYLLPIATLTNVGVFGNGRFFQNVLSHCYSSDLPEARRLASVAHAELDKVMPRYVKRAKRSDYQVATRQEMQRLTERLLTGIFPEPADAVTLADRGEASIAGRLTGQRFDATTLATELQQEFDLLTMAHMLYAHTNLPLQQIREVLRGLDQKTRDTIIRTYVGERKTRRDRPGRALEAGYAYTCDLLADFGTYKDLMRHRMTTQIRQRFTPTLGFAMPPDLEAAGFADRALACHDRAVTLYDALLPDFPEQASYATLHGSLTRWIMGFNDREAAHLIELRTTPQGHPSYRRLCQQMHDAIGAGSVWRGAAIKFADHNDYFWSRADSEARQRAEENALDKSKTINQNPKI